MRVGIDTSSLQSGHQFRGLGWYTKRLIDYHSQNIDVIKFSERLPSNVDLIHYPAFTLFQVKYKKNLLPTVVTVHDLIPLKYPEAYPLGLRGRLNWWRQKQWLKSVDRIITDSQASKKDIIKLTGICDHQIDVVYLAADPVFSRVRFKPSLKLPAKFVLYVGDLNWNKNVVYLSQLCLRLKLPLVVVGQQAKAQNYDSNHIENRELVEFQKLAKNNPSIIICPGYLDLSQLKEVYQRATVYCQPSRDEGFGLPVLEAMASGCPVLSSGNGSLPEITGKAALQLTAKNLLLVYRNESVRVKLVVLGQSQAKKFTWEKTVKETEKVYERVFNRS